MKKTENLEKVWGGSCIGENDENAEVVVFGIPFDDNVSYRPGAKDAPAAIRSTTYGIPVTTDYFENISDIRIADIGDFDQQGEAALFPAVEEKVADLVRRGKFFTMIGGDHSVTIPVLRGVDKAIDEELGIIHIDAHFDLCDTLCGSKTSHGCTERRATELNHVSSSENLFFLAIRSGEEEELDFMAKNPINLISAAEMEDMGIDAVIQTVKEKMARFNKIYLTVDIDCLDPGYAAGTGTPKFGGITPRQLLKLLRGLFDLPIMAFDVVEVAPPLDPSWTAVYAAQRIITECWGHQYRKTRKK